MAMPITVEQAMQVKTTACLQDIEAASGILWDEAMKWSEVFADDDCQHIRDYIYVCMNMSMAYDEMSDVLRERMAEYNDRWYPEEHDIYAQNERCLAMLGDTCVVDSARIDIDDIPF